MKINFVFFVLLWTLNCHCASFSSTSILNTRCNNYDSGVLLIMDDWTTDYRTDFRTGSKISFSVDEAECPSTIYEWSGPNDDELYSYKKIVPKGSFTCTISSLYDEKMYVYDCEHTTKDKYNIDKVTPPQKKDYNFVVKVTDPMKMENGGKYYIKGKSFSNGKFFSVGDKISWPSKTRFGKTTYEVKQGVRLEKKTIESISCTISIVYSYADFSEVSNCSWEFKQYEFYLSDPKIQENYYTESFRLYRSSGTLRYEGSIDVNKNSGNIEADGYCYSSDGMKKTKRVNRLDSCK